MVGKDVSVKERQYYLQTRGIESIEDDDDDPNNNMRRNGIVAHDVKTKAHQPSAATTNERQTTERGGSIERREMISFFPLMALVGWRTNRLTDLKLTKLDGLTDRQSVSFPCIHTY